MKACVKKVISLVLVCALALLSPIAALAADDDLTFPNLGEKTAEALTKPGEYEITLSVPGAVSSEEYSEVIVMADASSSMAGHYSAMKTMIQQLGNEILHDDGTVKLTLMGFGMGPRTAVTFSKPSQLNASSFLNMDFTALRQGVSATNCEAALQHVSNYINGKGLMKKTYVIFLSDGNANMDETPADYTTWRDHPDWYANGMSAFDIASALAGIQCDLLSSSGKVLPATAELYPEIATQLRLIEATQGISSEAYKAQIDTLYTTLTASESAAYAYLDLVFAHVFAEAGLDITAVSTSKAEKAFIDYAAKYADDNFPYALYYMIHRMNQQFYPDDYTMRTGDTAESGRPITWGARAAAAADQLANNSKVSELYMIDFSGNGTSWMKKGSRTNTVTSDNITYTQTRAIDAAIAEILSMSGELLTTIYKDVTVTDPMSKWVILDESSIRICKDDEVVWTVEGGWTMDNPPTESPISISTNASGHKQITWKIKDGPLLYSDRYCLKYVVNVDETAEGFEYGTEYPANDPTSVEYTDENDEEQTRDIPVPDVKENVPPTDLDEDDLGVRIYKSSSLTLKPISDITFSIYKVAPEAGKSYSELPTEEEIAAYAVAENLAAQVTTDGLGYAAAKLEQGIYMIVEHEHEKVQEPVAPFYVLLPMADPATGELINVITIYPKNIPVTPDTPDIPDEPEYPDDEEDEETKGRFNIIKHSSENAEVVLSGAQFQLFRPAVSGETPDATLLYNGEEIGVIVVQKDLLITDENGAASSGELPYGLYFLVEVQAPLGYNLLEDPVAILVTATSHETANTVMIANIPGHQLPSTGGSGVQDILLLGALLCGAALLGFAGKRAFYRA